MDCHFIDIRTLGPEDEATVARVLPRRFERADAYRDEGDRLRCIAAGLALIRFLGIESEDEFFKDANGKPFARGRKEFSLSHSGDLVLLATSMRPIGADIEHVIERDLRVAERVFTPAEIKWMHGEDKMLGAESTSEGKSDLPEATLLRFYILWTRKESAMKYSGRGLGLDPRSFEVLPEKDGRPQTGHVELGGEWVEIATCCEGDYVYSVCWGYEAEHHEV